jgi:transposase
LFREITLGLTYQQPRYNAREQDPAAVERFVNEKFPKLQWLAS